VIASAAVDAELLRVALGAATDKDDSSEPSHEEHVKIS
jgi:hypothetical protein